MHMGSVSVGYRVHFCVSTCGARCVYSFACMRVGTFACVYGCLFVYVCVRSGLRLHLTHHLSRPPPHHHALPVEDAAGALVVSRAGAGCSGERRPTLGGRLAGPGPTGLAGPRLGGGGPFFSLSCFLCPLVLSVIVWLNKRVYKIKLIN